MAVIGRLLQIQNSPHSVRGKDHAESFIRIASVRKAKNGKSCPSLRKKAHSR
jgi:hypothetical protein